MGFLYNTYVEVVLLKKIYTSVGVLTTKYEDSLYGMAVAWVFQVSFEPLLVAVGVGKNRRTLEGIKKAGRFAVSLMSEDNLDVVLRFGSKVENKWSGTQYTLIDDVPVIDGAIEYFTAEVVNMVETGDHVLVIGRVLTEKTVKDDKPPILYSDDGLIFIRNMEIKEF
jgi:flavin reductase (DIM6/NTAB) family NADH-FMN oxidoreductase RutF